MSGDRGAGGSRFIGPFEGSLLAAVFLTAAVSTLVGVTSPALHVERFWFFTRDISILSGIRDLIHNGQVLLGALILFLSVVLPLSKAVVGFLICLFVRETGPVLRGLLGLFNLLGKFSLTDVFVLAIGVIVLDGQLLTTANLGPGIYAFALGAILAWLGTMGLHARALSVS